MLHQTFVVLTAIAAAGLFLGGIDDVFIDVYYWLRELYRKLFLRRAIRAVPQEELCAPAEKSIAIWIPAWREHEVIEKMLLHSIDTIKYEKYAIFVGTYPNDPATQAAVDSISARYQNVTKIVCLKPGPTNKADCLNAVYEGMVRAERETGARYEIVALHDAEDVIHPLELKLFNWLIPHKDVVQIPVIPLERPLNYWTAGTYLDEFAEDHLKDLVVRERLARVIPSAGVGTAISRSVLEDLAATRGDELFNINSLTEDYEFGFGVASLNRTAILAQFSVALTQPIFRGGRRKRQGIRSVRNRIAVRAFFNDEFRQAIAQKTRWVLGISLQGWKNLGWPGGFWMRYMLYRDRKTLYTQPVYLLTYIVAIYWLMNLAIYGWRLMPGLGEWGWVRTAVIVDAFLLAHRLTQRAVAVARISDWRQALVSIPRSVVGNAINLCATAAAFKQFFSSERSGKPVAWQKTSHAFPSTRQLQEYNRRLGDLLLENRLVTIAELRHALKIQQQKGQKLGQVLTQMGYISEEDLLTVLGRHLNIPFGRLVQGAVDPDLLEKLPRETAERFLVLPLRSLNGFVEVACADPTAPQVTRTLEQLLGRPVSLRLATETDLRFAITRAYLAKEGGASRLLGELLVQAGAITAAELQQALKIQQKWGSRLGETMQDLGLISPEMLITALKNQEATSADSQAYPEGIRVMRGTRSEGSPSRPGT